MPITRVQARELTTQTEQELVEESFHPRVRSLNLAQLRQRVDRARRMRDKYMDLGRRQHKGTKRGQAQARRPREKANLRTDRKVTLFTQTLERFEKRLSGLEAEIAGSGQKNQRAADAAKGAGKATSGGAKPPAKTRAKDAAKGGSKAAPERREKHLQARGKAVHGHTKARGRRNQTRRDSR